MVFINDKLFILTTPFYEMDNGNFRDTYTYHIPHTGILREEDYPYTYLDHEVTNDELNNAINVIVTSLMQKKSNFIMVDLERREEMFTPTKEMTIEEIEEKLGHKIKIIK